MSRCSLTCDKVACQFGCPAGFPANCPVDCSIHSFRMVKNPFEVRAYMRRPATRLFITEFQTQFVQHAVDHYRALANEWMSARSIEEYLSQVWASLVGRDVGIDAPTVRMSLTTARR